MNCLRAYKATPVTAERLAWATPRGAVLVPGCARFVLRLNPFSGNASVTVTAAELAAFVGIELEDFAGAIVRSEVFASSLVIGDSYPTASRLYSYNLHAFVMLAGDELRLSAHSKAGEVKAWAMKKAPTSPRREDELQPRGRSNSILQA